MLYLHDKHNAKIGTHESVLLIHVSLYFIVLYILTIHQPENANALNISPFFPLLLNPIHHLIRRPDIILHPMFRFIRR